MTAGRAPVWLPGGHLQTLYPALALRQPAPDYHRQRLETPDGDFIDCDWTAPPGHTPLVVLFHGLEGNSRSHYATALMRAVVARGWTGVVAHFRGCSGVPNRTFRAYHCGDSAEIGWILARLKSRCGPHPLYAAGVSLGGNALLKWLGEQGDAAAALVCRAAAVSAPVDLPGAGARLDYGWQRWLYTRWFLRTLIPKAAAKWQAVGNAAAVRAIRCTTRLKTFDDRYTAPAHGFRDADDYWRQAAALPWLGHIRIPTLLVNARNDPFLSAGCFPGRDQLAPAVACDYPATGGHAGFPTGPFPGRLDWLPQRLLDFLAGPAASSRDSGA